MSGISPVVPGTPMPIIPPQVIDNAANTASYVPGWVLALSIFFVGSVLFILMMIYLCMIIFGQPMSVAKTSGSIIQHFNTSKSCVFKDSTISGGAFRYKNIRDGTVAATSNSVNVIRGKNIVLTFAQLGVTIPINVLGGISILVHNNINNINDLRRKVTYTQIYTEKQIDPETGEEEDIEVSRKQLMKNEVIVKGYDFDNFENLIKQSEEELLIPLLPEYTPDFVERNINADYTEKKIKIRQMLNTVGIPDHSQMQLMTIVIAVAILLVLGMFIK